MKTITLIYSFSLLILTSCIGNHSDFKKKPKFDYGKIVNHSYANPFLGIEINLPETWTIDSNTHFKSPFSPHFLEADLIDKEQNVLVSLNITGHMKNPFSKDETILDYLQESNESLGQIYDTNVHRENIEKTQIAHTKFYKNKVEILVENQVLYLDEYATKKNGYFYSITFSYSDTLQRTEIKNVLTRIKFN